MGTRVAHAQCIALACGFVGAIRESPLPVRMSALAGLVPVALFGTLKASKEGGVYSENECWVSRAKAFKGRRCVYQRTSVVWFERAHVAKHVMTSF